MSMILSLFIPHPVNIYIAVNTFIKYIHEGAESIGLIQSINTDHRVVTLRRFMSWVELLDYVGDDVFANISVWPDYVRSYPLYLCDTDVTMAIPVECIQGIAFVFYINDPILDAIQGMENTYQVTSQFASD